MRALVTGAASGIGRATALVFAREGARVVVADVAAEAGRQTVSAIQAAGGEALFVEADVSNSSQVQRLIQTTVDAFGRLDCAHNNAGISGGLARTHEFSEALWAQVLAINLWGPVAGVQACAPLMGRTGGGSIVNISSMAGMTGYDAAGYASSKWGLRGVTRTAALETPRSASADDERRRAAQFSSDRSVAALVDAYRRAAAARR